HEPSTTPPPPPPSPPRRSSAPTAFAESTLAQSYKERINTELKGGVPYYLHKVFQKRWIGMIAAVTALLLYIILAPGIQSNSIAVTAANSNSPRGRRSADAGPSPRRSTRPPGSAPMCPPPPCPWPTGRGPRASSPGHGAPRPA